MMTKSLIAAGLLSSALLASAAMAQTAPAPAPQPGVPAAANFMTRLEPGQMLASRIMDGDVVGTDNKDIGDVEDVVLDRNGRVVALVVEIDEGIGDRTVALPLSAFRMNSADAATTGSLQTGTPSAAWNDDDMRIVVTVPLDQLKSAPEFDDND